MARHHSAAMGVKYFGFTWTTLERLRWTNSFRIAPLGPDLDFLSRRGRGDWSASNQRLEPAASAAPSAEIQ